MKTEVNSDSIYVNSGSSITINGGTFKSSWNGLMVGPSHYENSWNVASVVINGGTFIGENETGLSVFGTDSLEINGGTFIGGYAGFRFEEIDNVSLKGGIYKANNDDALGAIAFYGNNSEIFTNILGEGFVYEPELESKVITNDEMRFVVSQKEISVIESAKNDYSFIEGENLEYNIDNDDAATFRINADYRFFNDGGMVYVDDSLVENSNYTSESGSTIIKFTKQFMNTLSVGKHT